jgi:uncharacterized protein with gpF-like domain
MGFAMEWKPCSPKRIDIQEVEMDYDKALDQFEEEFINWIYSSRRIGNGDMLIQVMEDGHSFYTFMHEQHPEIELN